jgi:hypothetical protein
LRSIKGGPAGHRQEHTHGTSESRLSVCLQLCFSGTGLLQPEFHGKVPATRGGRDTGADLCHDARGNGTALVFFFQRIERLELEARRLSGLTGEGPAASASRKQVVTDVSVLRRAGEINAYIDLLFLAMVVLLCVSKIVTN